MNKLDEICKFKIGQLCTVKAHRELAQYLPQTPRSIIRGRPKPQVMQVLDRIVHECYGGVQVAYECRAHMVQSDTLAFGVQTLKLMEPELEPFDAADWKEMDIDEPPVLGAGLSSTDTPAEDTPQS